MMRCSFGIIKSSWRHLDCIFFSCGVQINRLARFDYQPLSTTAVDRTCPSCPFFFDDNNHSFFLTIVKD
jgi:hypothetical protein